MLKPLYQLDRKKVLLRLMIVWVMALFIALWKWNVKDGAYTLSDNLAYSYAIATSIWFFSDPFRWLMPKVIFKSTNWQLLYQVLAMLTGYILGTYFGDLYSGYSTWDLWQLDPAKFKGLLISAIFISFAFCAYFFQQSKTYAAEQLHAETQLRLLHAQLEPHMLFNTLANLRGLIAQDPAKAQQMLDQLIAFLRGSLHASRQSLHSVQAEFAALQSYLQLMQIRMGERLTFDFDLPLELQDKLVPTLILQPLVENSIRHGLETQIEGGTIKISARQQDQHLILCVQDNGVGFEDTMTTTDSFGLTHVRERLTTLYGRGAELTISSQPQALTQVTLSLPLTSQGVLA
jgi:two-component sensor histidine kinase